MISRGRKLKSQQTSEISSSAFLFVILGLVLVSVNAVPAQAQISPLHAGASTQQKKGTLGIGSSLVPARLCLNDDTTTTLDDATNCISDWSEINGVTDSYTKIASVSVPVFDGFTSGVPDGIIGDQPGEYTPQLGYINLKSGLDQKFTAILKAPNINFCEDIDDGFGNCSYTHTKCASNLDCVYGISPNLSKNVIGTAVYGAGSGDSYAGYFGGTVYVRKSADGLRDGHICLNGLDDLSCQSSWNGISATQFVKRQASNSPTAQAYGAQITGVAFFGSAVIGGQVGGSFNPSPGVTCGNGLCEANEDQTICPFDCLAAPATPPSSGQTMASIMGSTPLTPKVQLHLTAGAPQTGAVTLLVVRSALTPTSWRPVDGTTYIAGTGIGNAATIVAVETTTSGGQVDTLDKTFNTNGDVFATGKKYYYQVYQANAARRYSQPTSPMELRLFKVDIGVTSDQEGNEVAEVTGDYVTSSQVPSAGLYIAGSDDTLWITVNTSTYCPSRWDGCDSSTINSCTVSIDYDRSIYLFSLERWWIRDKSGRFILSPCDFGSDIGDVSVDQQN